MILITSDLSSFYGIVYDKFSFTGRSNSVPPENPLPEYLTMCAHVLRRNTQRQLYENTQWRTDWIQPLCILLLGITGVFFIYSAQLHSGQSQWVRQSIWLILGAGVYTAVALIDYKVFLEKAHLIYSLTLLLLLILELSSPPVNLPLLGVERGNAWRWIDFGFFHLQPTEAAKVGVLIIVCGILARSEIGTVRESVLVLLKVALATFFPIWLIFLQPDLGSTLVFPPMVFALLYVSKFSARFFAGAIAVFLLLVGILAFDIYRYHAFLRGNNIAAHEGMGLYEKQSWLPLRDYQRNRILVRVAPEAADPKGIGAAYNVLQSLISVGSGGLDGKGWLKGTQAKLGYLPQTVAPNDFIYAVLAEETGFVGCAIVLGLFGLILGNGIRIAGLARDRFGMLLAVGSTVIFLVHVFINVGMTIGLMPITGLPLPFLSYGGSFILSCCILQGLLQSVYRYRREFS